MPMLIRFRSLDKRFEERMMDVPEDDLKYRKSIIVKILNKISFSEVNRDVEIETKEFFYTKNSINNGDTLFHLVTGTNIEYVDKEILELEHFLSFEEWFDIKSIIEREKIDPYVWPEFSKINSTLLSGDELRIGMVKNKTKEKRKFYKNYVLVLHAEKALIIYPRGSWR